ncbi:DNA polymerase lambda [Lachnellula suecica]|uniref:DNA polymerase lambda n=1 Tax=Lachnellula suecica TaxID=602035 RepID=A0A8T9CLI0_9HELO|nr:DNA polymerase lambda [Lachnellula suecica]
MAQLPPVPINKAEYFEQLSRLNDPSDDDEDPNDVSHFLNESDRLLPPLLPSSSPQSPERRSPNSTPLRLSSNLPEVSAVRHSSSIGSKKPPTIHRANSAPVPSARVVKETPLIRKVSLLRYGTSTPPSESSFSGYTTSANASCSQRPDTERRTVSDPLILKPSTGITSMLSKNHKRKRDTIALVPEGQRIFRGLRFYYFPANDISPVRRKRIMLARNHGAIWTKELADGVTHFVVDKSLSYQDITAHLKLSFNVEALPKDVMLVNEDFPLDCIQSRRILVHNQVQYTVERNNIDSEEKLAPQQSPQAAEESQELEEDLQRRTPPREDSPSQSGDIDFGGASEEASQTTSITSNFPKSGGYKDALDEMIELAQRTKHLPLDDDDDDEDRPSSSGDIQDLGNYSDDYRERTPSPTFAPQKKRKYSKGPKGSFNQESFSCMKGGTGISTESNRNSRTIDILQHMADVYDRVNDRWRTLAYRKAIGILRTQTRKISTFDEAFALQHIGERIAKKIEEIAFTNSLRKLEYAKSDPRNQVLEVFLQIYEVGLAQARVWIDQGHKTIEDLKAHAHLTRSQKIGIEHYDDFNTRIPREQVAALGEVVKKSAATIDEDVETTIMGSYRRGTATSGDIDILITKPGTTSTSELMGFLNDLVNDLTNSGFLVAALAVPRAVDGQKWHGACALPGNPIWRRIDFLLVPESELGAALIYFTGDDIFNRSMRLLASKKGDWRLNQKGLYKNVMRGQGRVKLNEGALLEGADEEKIFQALGVPYRRPENRICH